jgi:signal transduction histidine kinase
VDGTTFGARGSLRRRVTVLLVVAGAIIAVMVVGAFLTLSRLSGARERVADRYDPALVASAQLLAAAVDQETGLRGFVLSGESSFLEPWTAGQAQEIAITRRLAGLLRGDPLATRALEAFETASVDWREQVGTPISESDPGEVTEDQVTLSKTLFDGIRARHAVLEETVQQQRDRARNQLHRAADWLLAWLIAMTVMLVAMLIGIAVELRRSVLRPLGSAVEQVKLVADGDIDHEVRVTGPSEFVQLGAATDVMRRQIVGQLREVGERRAELAASNRELEQFAYVASHDLQEPLRKVTAFCQMLQQRYGGQLDERADSYIDFAVDGATRMQALINDLLTLSRVGRTSGSMSDVELDDVVARAVMNVSESIDEAGAIVDVGALPMVRGERTLLIALFQNLISNAVKFRDPSRPPIISIGMTAGQGGRTAHDDNAADDIPHDFGPHNLGADDDTGEHQNSRRGAAFEFYVTDNGIGIEPQYQDRVFVVFQRLHTREEYDGTGIGLSICRKIVEHHGGRLWIADDHIGPGITFKFTLPDPNTDDESDERNDTENELKEVADHVQ